MKVEKVRFVWICDEPFSLGFYVTSVYPKTIMKILLYQESKVISSGNERKLRKVQANKKNEVRKNHRLLSMCNRNGWQMQDMISVLLYKSSILQEFLL